MNIFFSVYSLSSSTTIQIILIYVLFSPRYGSGVLEDNLVARVYTSYETEGHFLAFYTVLNCYIYLLAYVYSPSSTQVSDGDGSAGYPNFGYPRISDIRTSDFRVLKAPWRDRARKFKKVQAKKLVKSNKLISQIIFLTKFHFLQSQKLPKINF